LKNLYRIKNEEEFKNDLEKLLKHYEPLSPEILIENQSIKIKKPGFIISFDDGLREVYEVISPVLEAKGIPAIFFLNNSFINSHQLFYRYKVSIIVESLLNSELSREQTSEIKKLLQVNFSDRRKLGKYFLKLGFRDLRLIDNACKLLEIDIDSFLKASRPYMEEKEILELRDKGFFLGAHGFDHQEFSTMDENEQISEVIKSIKDITDRFSLDYSFFAYPFTDFHVSNKVFNRVNENLKSSSLVTFGTAGMKKKYDYSHYQRISMEKYTGHSERILKTEYFYYNLKKILGR
jgi:peptidoglycan/xylan/chitin deacetylase (PgdA/CDA1 family)